MHTTKWVETPATAWGRRIRSAREARGFTQADLARRVNVDQTTVSRWEAGLTSPGPFRQVAIAKHLGCTWADLFTTEAEGTT